jgi:Ras-related GTP-binding protein C/D
LFSFEDSLASTLNDDDDKDGQARPRILLMGTRRSGKSSIQKVVFHKMSPHETLFLESTNEIRVRGE